MSLKPDTIRAIFTNILFVIGVILLIVGFVRATSTVANLVTFEKYPLANYEETRCEYEIAARPVIIDDKNQTAESLEDIQKRKDTCLVSVERQRQQKQVDDIITSISLLVSGAALVIFFKKFIVKG